MNKFKGKASIIINIILVVFIIIVGTLVVSPKEKGLTQIGDFSFAYVMTGSMEPTIKVGSLCIVKEQAEYDKQDIITYRGEGSKSIVTHRIISTDIGKDGALLYTTQGDANNIEDSVPVKYNNILGEVVFTIPYLGVCIQWIQQNIFLFLFLSYGTVTLMAFIKRKLIK